MARPIPDAPPVIRMVEFCGGLLVDGERLKAGDAMLAVFLAM